jgi:hypothetical protein
VGYFSKKMTEKMLNRLMFLTSKPVNHFSFGGLLLSGAVLHNRRVDPAAFNPELSVLQTSHRSQHNNSKQNPTGAFLLSQLSDNAQQQA